MKTSGPLFFNQHIIYTSLNRKKKDTSQKLASFITIYIISLRFLHLQF
ncbi:hypothetical protein BSBH6_01600 [Bacillus subtilis]|nr:hypothetical protein BSBH6_01600 [Bacillus subtilis]RPK25677.1 hypothetical protein BH5_02509 [Bacillus subtilis]